MALLLTGYVNGMRPVGGIVEEGDHKGEEWHFLSLEIVDPRYGNVYSCQLRDQDGQYGEYVSVSGNKHTLAKDIAGHKVKVTIKGQVAGEREIKDKQTGERRTVLQVRSQITNIRDLGLPMDDEE